MTVLKGPKALLIFLKWIPMIAFSYVMVAPSLTITKIWKDKNVGNYESFPFVSFIGNCGVWLIYGLLSNESTIWISNGIGFLAGLIFTYVYASFGKIPCQNYSFAAAMNSIAIGLFFAIQLGLSKQRSLFL